VTAPVVSIRGLRLAVQTEAGLLEIVSGVSLDLLPGQTLALVGESGCGKSATCLCLGRLHPEPPMRYLAGTIEVQGRDVLRLGERELRRLRGSVVSYVFQEPSVCLNPVLRVGTQIREALRLQQDRCSDLDLRVVELLRRVGIPEPELRASAFPHELSGGMQQRVMIAMAISGSPAVLVADEPTTALDVTVQAQILGLLKRLQEELRTAVLLVTHDLGVVAEVADQVAIMYAGQIVERAPVASLFRRPAHPYTQALLRSVPRLSRDPVCPAPIPGQVPLPGSYPPGCRFAPRCRERRPECASGPVPELECGEEHRVCCRAPAWGDRA
jgi:oligopeptide/dipeptide ABC transporter ATP-binding protein